MQGAWVPSLVRELIPHATSKDLVCLSITTIVVYSLSHVWFFCDPMDFSLPGSSVHRIFQARVLEWVVISYSKGSSWPRNWTHISCIGRWILYHWATWEAQLRPSAAQFSCHSAVSDSLWPRESQHTRPPCLSPTPGVHSVSRPSSRWCHPAISSSVVPFSSCAQSLPASESFPVSQLFAWGGQSIRVSALASVLPMNTQDWSPLGWTG